MKMRDVRYVRAIKLAAGMLCAYMFVSGCSGLDDLCLHNNYDFAVTLTYHYKTEYRPEGSTKTIKEEGEQKYGPVAAHQNARFHGAAGYHGDFAEQDPHFRSPSGYHGGFLKKLQVRNETGTDLGTLEKVAKKVDEGTHSACNGTTVWDVTVEP